MKIILTEVEYSCMKRYAYSIDKDSAESFEKEAIASKLVKYSKSTVNDAEEHIITVDNDYLIDILLESSEFAGIVAPLIRSSITAFKYFSDKLDAITAKHKSKFKTADVENK